MKKITKTIKIFTILLLPLLLASPLPAEDNFTTIYPEENGKAVVEENSPTKNETEATEEIIQEDNEIDEVSEQTEETIIDENTKTISNQYFDLTLERKNQTPFGKSVLYILTVTPHIDSAETQILWNTPSTLESNPRHKEFVALESGQTYTFKARIKPLRGGVFDFSVSVISWQHDTNYTNSISDNIVFNNNLVLQPVSTEYQLLNILRFFLIFLAFGGVIWLVIFIAKKYAPKAKKWLTPPDW